MNNKLNEMENGKFYISFRSFMYIDINLQYYLTFITGADIREINDVQWINAGKTINPETSDVTEPCLSCLYQIHFLL